MLLATLFCPLATANDLQDYVELADDTFAFEIESQETIEEVDVYTIRLSSLTWRGKQWTHWLSVLVPARIEHPDAAVFCIVGGRNGKPRPQPGSEVSKWVAAITRQTGAVVAILQQVPNQPMLDDLHEDALIAETFLRYLDAGDEAEATDWPLLKPMVRLAVRGMDAVQQFATDDLHMGIERFVVTGASKRGWTTWLTAAVDPRVSAIAPMVFDILNFGPQLGRHAQDYGGPSHKVGDYTSRGIMDRLDSPRGRRLLEMVDPFAYRDRIQVPKLILLGTNDPYWTVDAAGIYFPHLDGSKHLAYVPNTGHGLGVAALPTLAAFLRVSLSGETLPPLHWHRNEDGTLRVRWDQPDARAILWTAHSDTRDFRQARWNSRPLPGAGSATARIDEPENGHSASFVQVWFPAGDSDAPAVRPPYSLSTEMIVAPPRPAPEDARE